MDEPLLDEVTRDLVRMAGIARGIVSIKEEKLGALLLSRKESDAESPR